MRLLTNRAVRSYTCARIPLLNHLRRGVPNDAQHRNRRSLSRTAGYRIASADQRANRLLRFRAVSSLSINGRCEEKMTTKMQADQVNYANAARSLSHKAGWLSLCLLAVWLIAPGYTSAQNIASGGAIEGTVFVVGPDGAFYVPGILKRCRHDSKTAKC